MAIKSVAKRIVSQNVVCAAALFFFGGILFFWGRAIILKVNTFDLFLCAFMISRRRRRCFKAAINERMNEPNRLCKHTIDVTSFFLGKLGRNERENFFVDLTTRKKNFSRRAHLMFERKRGSLMICVKSSN